MPSAVRRCLTGLARLCYNRLISSAAFRGQEGITVDTLLAGINLAGRSLVIASFAYTMFFVFVFAGLSYHKGEYLMAIAATGMLATLLLVVQTMDRSTFMIPLRDLILRLRNLQTVRTAWNTFVVGVAIHYSAIFIGVSLGTVFSVAENDSTWAIVAVIVQQAVLTRAAWVLVNEYRQSNAGKNRKP